MKNLLLFVCLFICMAANAQPGTLDNTFGTGGKVLENGSVPEVKVIDIVSQTDGKLLMLAQATYNHLPRAVLLRYTTTGTLDNTFGTNGIAVLQFGPTYYTDNALAMKLQTDGKIVVCGQTVESVSVAVAARYNTNGSPDAGFGTNGIAYINDQGINKINDLVILPSGEIVLLTTSSDFFRFLVLVKLTGSGSHATGFGINGVVRITVDNNYEPAYSQLELQSDGKFVIGGTPYFFQAPDQNNLLLVRLTAGGVLDNTFGTNGVLEADAGPAETDNLADISLQTDGKIVATGYGTHYNHKVYTYAARITTGGVADNTFGNNGFQYISTAATGFASFGQMALQADNKTVVAGFARNAQGNYTLAAARLTTTGVLDNTFNTNGIALLLVNNYSSYGFAPALQANGSIVLAGLAGNGMTFSATIGRLTTTGQTDATIAAGSTAIAYPGNSADFDIGTSVLVQTDQKIINIRKRENGFLHDITATRYLTNGAQDNGFGTNGKLYINIDGEYNYTTAAQLTNGSTVVVAGLNELVKGNEIALVRLNSAGKADSAFGTNGRFLLATSSYAETYLQNAFVQPDGKTVLLISERIDLSHIDTAYLIRLNADGSYDATFNTSGKLRLSDTASYSRVFVQTDGKILLTFTSKDNGYQYSTFALRYNAGGTVDAGFNSGNPVQTGTDLPVLTVQSDRKIVLADMNGKLIRLNTNGSFDNTFDGDGKAQLSFTYNVLSGIQLQANNSIILGGNTYSPSYDSLYFQAVRITATGRLDSTFGTGGIAGVNVVPDNQNNADAISLQADGKIIMSGYTTYSNTYNADFAMIRLLGNNVPAPVVYTFNGSGSWTVASNWLSGVVPPTTLPSGSSIIIDPPPAGICYLNIPVQHISAGASLIVKAGKRFVLNGNLVIQ